MFQQIPKTAVAAVVFCLTLTTCASADDSQNLQPLLEHAILAPDQTLRETQEYLEAHLPPLPVPAGVTDWEKYASRIRQQVLDRVVFRGQARVWRDGPARMEWLDTIEGGSGYHIKKLRYEALPGLWIPALLYVPDVIEGKVPAILNVNGHDSNGKAAKYKQIRCINLARRGMLVLNPEWLGMGQLSGENYRHGRMNQLDLCGTSGLAPFYLAMKRGLDVLLSLDQADPERVAVSGLSGGGWQTITISSLDTRVKLSNPVAGYSSLRTRVRNFSDLGDSEQTPCDLATVADYEYLTALMAPRPTLLTFNVKDDCCFAADHALPPLLDAARPIFRLYGKELSLRWHVNHHPGTHNFERENREAFYRMVGDFFYADVAGYDSQEIACDPEVKTKEQLHIELPPDNANFHSLAIELSKSLPHEGDIPGDKSKLAQWQEARRRRLAEVVQAKSYKVVAERTGSEKTDGVQSTFWRLKLDDSWSVPVVELVRGEGEPKATAILVADGGRKSVAAEAERLLAAGNRVLAVDPFYFGESKISQRDYLFALLILSIGDRPLGIQASQLSAIARWSNSQHKTSPVALHAFGPRASTFSLVAAALGDQAIGSIELHDSFESMKEVLQKNWSFEQAPEMFCFGLLDQFDMEQLTALVAPRPVAVK